MKYIIYILALSISLMVLAIYLSVSRHASDKDIALTINNRHITRDEFNKRFTDLYQVDKQGFINTLITKELMIQEAQKEGIDKTEAFRYSIQEYYEESLFKQIMDKKIKSLKVIVNNDELDKHLAFQNSTLSLTIFRAANEELAKKGQFKVRDARVTDVKNLSSDIGERLENLNTGEHTAPLCSDLGCDVILLNKIERHPIPGLSIAEREEVRKILVDRKKQKALDAWIADLKARSDIAVMIK